MTIEEKRNVLVGIRFDSHTKELLDWAVVKVANPGDRVFAVHVRRNSDATSKEKLLLDDYLVDYEGLCSKKQVDLKAEILKGCSIKKALVKEAISINAAAVIVGISKHTAIGGWLSIAKYCAKHLPLTIEVIAVHNGKVVFQSISDTKLSSFAGDPRPSFSSVKNCNSENQSEFGESEISDTSQLSLEVTRSSEDDRDGTENPPEEYSDDQPGWPLLRKVVIPKKNRDLHAYLKEGNKKHTKGSLSTISLPTEDFTKQRPGWPLLQSVSSITKQTLEARNMSVVQWAMKLPEHPLIEPPLNDDKTVQVEDSEHEDFKMFSYEELRTLTSQFSPENLIGQGGCSRVYKAVPPEGKPVAVKITNSSTEACNSFNLEVEIMSTLNHPNIAPLLGNCVEDQDLITVYHFFAKGNLAENLYSDSTKKTPLQWKARFDIAVGVAEALNYLHNKSPRPIIHRDVKSSNILLTPEFKPQLADFGLAIWGPTKSAFLTESDVVGTFGYLAPEYFMYGKVSDKLDVYAFGVVLLELLSGRKPIGVDSPKGQESLVMWGKPKLESEDFESIIEPKLIKSIDKDQMKRMCIAAKLCLTQAARLRPKMNQILKILQGEKEVNEDCDVENHQDGNDDEVYPNVSKESRMSLALVGISDHDSSTSYSSTSFSSTDQTSPFSVDGYFKDRWSRSSSLDD